MKSSASHPHPSLTAVGGVFPALGDKDEGIASQIPPWIVVASKSGKYDHSQSDMAVVYSPSGAYALTVFTKDTKATRSGLLDERAQAIRAISRAVWRHYNPNDKWEPPVGVVKYWSK